MNRDNTKRLLEEFGHLFGPAVHENGFGCQDGWYEVVHRLFSEVREAHRQGLTRKLPEITAVGQSLGVLQIEVNGCDENLRWLFEEARQQSKATCELDGHRAIGLYVCAPHWFRHLCAPCAARQAFMSIEDYQGHCSTEQPDCPGRALRQDGSGVLEPAGT